MLTEKENFYRMVNHEEPEFIPGVMNLVQIVVPSCAGDRPLGAGGGPGVDGFGVKWVSDGLAPAVPDPNPQGGHLLKDICDWREVVQFPDIDNADWEKWAEKDLAQRDPEKIIMVMITSGPFERLHDLMGFEGALEATVTEPEECEAFFSAMCDFRVRQLKYIKKYYNPELIQMQDDWGSQKDLLFHPDFWRTALKPHIKRVVDACHELGMLFNLHTCGKVDRIIDDIVDLGIDMLDSMMVCNDLDHWMDAYGHKLIFMGGLDTQGVIDRDDKTFEDIQEEVIARVNRYAPKGYYIPMPYGTSSNSFAAMAFAAYYGMTFYHPEIYKERAEGFMSMVMQMIQSGHTNDIIPTKSEE